MSTPEYEHIAVSEAGRIGTIEVRRGPNNFIDTDMVGEISDALEAWDKDPNIRAIVLCSEGKHFAPAPISAAAARMASQNRRSAGAICTRKRSVYGVPASQSWRRSKARRSAPAPV